MELNNFVSGFKGTQIHYKWRTLVNQDFSFKPVLFHKSTEPKFGGTVQTSKNKHILKKLLVIACKDKQTKTQHIHIKPHPSKYKDMQDHV